jgi:hypothetical protein
VIFSKIKKGFCLLKKEEFGMKPILTILEDLGEAIEFYILTME